MYTNSIVTHIFKRQPFKLIAFALFMLLGSNVWADDIPLIRSQFIAYYAALHRGYDIDKPRNLAKSVTVE